jgi:hypothetical protein
MAHTAPLYQENGDSVAAVTGGADTGYDLGSTKPNYTTKEMAIGGMDTVPMSDAGVQASAPDLTPTELKAGGGKVDKRRMYNVIKVKGAPLPSENAKYVGSTPSAAVSKAARRIFKKSNVREFTVLMRRVSPRHIERELHQYDIKMVKAKKPEGFITITADTFTPVTGATQRDVDKKVRIVQSSDNPVWGYLQEGGRGVKGAPANKFPLVRGKGTNTLTLVVPGAIPDKVQGVNVNKTEWDVRSTRSESISTADKKEYDTASHVKERESLSLQAKKQRESAKRESEREKARNAKLKQAEAAAREKAREKERAAKVKAAEAKANAVMRTKAKKQREAAALAAAKMRAKAGAKR